MTLKSPNPGYVFKFVETTNFKKGDLVQIKDYFELKKNPYYEDWRLRSMNGYHGFGVGVVKQVYMREIAVDLGPQLLDAYFLKQDIIGKYIEVEKRPKEFVYTPEEIKLLDQIEELEEI